MPLQLPRDAFQNGSEWSIEVAQAAANEWPLFNGNMSFMGSRPGLQDSELDQDPGSILGRVNSITEGFRVTADTGRQIEVAAGVYLTTAGVRTDSSQQVLPVPEGTSYAYLTSDGVEVGAVLPAVCVPLAKVVSTAVAVSTIEDLRDLGYRQVGPRPEAIRVLGGTSETDLIATNGLVLDQGEYYVRDFIVPAAATVTISGYAHIRASGRVQIDGTVHVTSLLSGFPATALILSNLSLQGQSPGQGLGGNGNPYPFGAQRYGSGGAQGAAQSDTTGQFAVTGPAGNGGGLLKIDSAGPILVQGTITANGTMGLDSTATIAGQAQRALISGAGGGSGGTVDLSSAISITVTPGAAVLTNGGGGGVGRKWNVSAGFVCMILGGYGGGGGQQIYQSPDTNTSGAVLNANGGLSGAYSGATSVAADTWQVVNPQLILGGGRGGGNGGATGGFVDESTVPGTFRYRRVPGTPGKIIYLPYIPVG